ncbi:TPA: hypothetical protein ACGD5C_001917 [Serratia marcescens]
MTAVEELLKNKVPFVTISTVVIYFVALSFQYGNSIFFGYPTEFIEIGLDTLLKTVAWVVFFSFLVGGVLYFYYRTFNLERLLAFPVAVLAIFSLLYLSILGTTWPWELQGRASMFLPLGIAYLSVYPVIFFSEGIMSGYFQSKTIGVGMLAFLVVFMLSFSAISGSLVAYKMDSLFVVKDKPGVYLIAGYGGRLVLGECTLDSVVFNRTDGENIQFVKVNSVLEKEKLRSCFLKKREK